MKHRFVLGAMGVFVGTTALLGCTVAATTGAAQAGTPSSRTMIRASSNESTNWSGYGEAGSYTSIGSSWTVPTVTPTASATDYSSTWIGIDGLNNSHLIQTGTESDVINGVVHYDAWWEILPAAERVIKKMTVNPGDHMTASISTVAAPKWKITLTDVTSGATFTLARKYKGPAVSAEWIQERPQIGRNLGTLAPYSTVTFTGMTANGGSAGLVPADAISMVNDDGSQVISTPSALSPLGDSFSVAYGSTAPPAPPG